MYVQYVERKCANVIAIATGTAPAVAAHMTMRMKIPMIVNV